MKCMVQIILGSHAPNPPSLSGLSGGRALSVCARAGNLDRATRTDVDEGYCLGEAPVYMAAVMVTGEFGQRGDRERGLLLLLSSVQYTIIGQKFVSMQSMLPYCTVCVETLHYR